MKTTTFTLILFLLAMQSGKGQSPALQAFPLSEVRLLEGSPFYQAQNVNMAYIMALDPDLLLAPFLIDAGIPPKAERYGNWENTGLDGHTGGHYLTALAQLFAATGEPRLRERLNYMLDELEACQQKNGNGYVGGIPNGNAMWQDIAKGKIEANSFSLNGKWVPWYNLHKLFAGLRDVYLITGHPKAKAMLIRLSDWCWNVTNSLSEAQMQDMLRSEHGGMNEVLADVATTTQNNKYLEMAQRFSHRAILDPLLAGKDNLTGAHANTQIPKVIGYKKVADRAGLEDWSRAADFFWHTVVNQRSVSIGGNSVREHFHPENDFSSMIESNQGPETCNTYNMIRLSTALFLTNPQAKYLDYYERSLYNHILSSQHPEKGGFVYFTPMRPRHYRVYSQPANNFWCCVGSGIESHGKFGELIYAQGENVLYVNLFIPSVVEWKKKGIQISQQNQFPYEEKTLLKIGAQKPQRFALKVRYPGWVKSGALEITVNGKPQKAETDPSGFVTIDQKWKQGDEVLVILPMHTQVAPLPDQSPWVSFLHGPIVLAAATDTTDLAGLFADDSRMGHVAEGKWYPADEAPMLVSDRENLAEAIQPVPGEPLTFSLAGTVFPDQYQNLYLKPFFSLHEARYMLYWPVSTREGLEAKKQEMMEKEKEQLTLEARTIDQVAPGEQQPESEHNLQGERHQHGIHQGRFYRAARDWFSYDLRDRNREARTLRLVLWGGDNQQAFDIFVNELLVKTVQGNRAHGEGFYLLEIPLTEGLLTYREGGVLNVRFQAKGQAGTGGGIRSKAPEMMCRQTNYPSQSQKIGQGIQVVVWQNLKGNSSSPIPKKKWPCSKLHSGNGGIPPAFAIGKGSGVQLKAHFFSWMGSLCFNRCQ